MGKVRSSACFIIVIMALVLCRTKVYAASADELFLAGSYGQALTEYESQAKEEPGDFKTGLAQAMCLLKTERYYAALEKLQMLQPESSQERRLANEAELEIKALVEKGANEEVIHYYQGLVDQPDYTFDTIRRIVMQYPDYPRTKYYQGRLMHQILAGIDYYRYTEETRVSMANYFGELAEEYPEERGFTEIAEQIYLQSAYYEEARALAGRLEGKSQELLSLLYTCQLRCMLETGDLEAAGIKLEQALKRYPENYVFYLLLGDYEAKRKNYEEAAFACQKAIAISPEQITPYIALMKIYILDKKYDEALMTGKRLEQIQKNDIYGMAYMFLAYKGAGDRDMARRYEKKITDYSENDYHKACALNLIGHREQAVRILYEISGQEVFIRSESQVEETGLPGEKYRLWARNDADFKSLHTSYSFQQIVREDYVEEYEWFLILMVLILGCVFFGVIAKNNTGYESVLEYHKKRKVVSGAVLLMILVLCGSVLNVSTVEARNWELEEHELLSLSTPYNGELSGEPLMSPQETEECCQEQILWLQERMLQAARVLEALQEEDIYSAARMVRACTVNLQFLNGDNIYGQGTGVITSITDRSITIIGCRHTLYTDHIQVRFMNEDLAEAKLIGKSDNYDFMVLKVSLPDIKAETRAMIRSANIDYSADRALGKGQDLFSTGFFTGKNYVYFQGEVTKLNEVFHNFEPYYTNNVPYLITSTKAAEGTSGGGTYDAYGHFLGIQAGIVIATEERYVVPLKIIASEYRTITGEKLE